MTSYSAPARRVGRLKRPFGNLYYEVTGHGPGLIFAHGLGGNHLSWWQQVAHFAPHYTCVTFAHRGFAPSDPIPVGPDAADYAGDIAVLIDHLALPDVRLVGQSMGGWTVLEYALAQPHRVKALVMSATSGTLDRRACDRSGGAKYDAWLKDAEAKIADGLTKGIHPAMGAPAAARFPALHLLYRSIDEMAGNLDKEKVRATLRRTAQRTLAELGSGGFDAALWSGLRKAAMKKRKLNSHLFWQLVGGGGFEPPDQRIKRPNQPRIGDSPQQTAAPFS